KGKVLVEGAAVGKKIGQGEVNVIKQISEISKFKTGQVLVTEMTDPDWEPIMKEASAIITDAGGRTCHAAIVSRELGIPCVVGTGKATEVIKQNQPVTVSGAEGEVGRVYDGLLKFKVKKTNIKNLKRPRRVKVMMNVGNPEAAFAESFIPNDGVGLAREEFIISNFIKIHPLALINYAKIKKSKDPKNQEVIRQIDELTAAYQDKVQFYVDKLAYGIGRIAGAFYPKEVIVRLSDFKSNEYANLIGGENYEPAEDNPMLGWRGASRYYDPKYIEGFKLECLAFKKAREEMGLTNIKIMVPFCRTVEEGKKVLKIMAEHGLKRGVKNLEVYVMCEIPSNVILGDEFSKIFDGFSIGSNDLTQLTLGVDRDSELVSHVYDENNEAVKKLIRQIIKTAHQRKRKVGICGQAPSDFPEFAQFLVREGIDSISLIPDSVVATTMKIIEAEK
ncbi:MAG TPA: phosphoenolpyruvate synthase, partial [Patescibacteria group bacterium]|nr:phosphoenolpyruvate synthase [Patescibacteria group bacterium]